MEMMRQGEKSFPLAPVHIFTFLFSIAAGLFFLLLVELQLNLPMKFFLTFFAGSLLFTVSLIVPDKKKFYLVLMVFALAIGLSKTFAFSRSYIFRSTFGYTVYASFVPLIPLYFIWLYRAMFREEGLPLCTRGLFIFICIFIMSAISCFLAHSYYSYFDLWVLGCSIVLFVYVASDVRDLSELRLITKLLIALASFEGILALGQYLTGSNLGFGFVGSQEFLTGYIGLLSVSRVMGSVGHPNSLAMVFDFLLPLSFTFLLFYPMEPWKRALLGLSVLLQYLGLGVTFSRGGITCSSLAMAIIFFVYLRRRIDIYRGLAIFLFIGMLFSILVVSTPNPIQRGLFRTESESALGRIPLIKVALNVIRSRPLFGLGPNTYVEKVGQYDTTPEQLNAEWNSPVHNLYLFIAGEAGIPVLVFFLILLWMILHPLPGISRSAEPVLACSALGILMGSLAFLGHCMVDLTLWTHPRLHWFMFGLAVSVWRLSLEYESPRQPARMEMLSR